MKRQTAQSGRGKPNCTRKRVGIVVTIYASQVDSSPTTYTVSVIYVFVFNVFRANSVQMPSFKNVVIINDPLKETPSNMF